MDKYEWRYITRYTTEGRWRSSSAPVVSSFSSVARLRRRATAFDCKLCRIPAFTACVLPYEQRIWYGISLDVALLNPVKNRQFKLWPRLKIDHFRNGDTAKSKIYAFLYVKFAIIQKEL